jgi:DNA-binding GntR family transcriptional regulator
MEHGLYFRIMQSTNTPQRQTARDLVAGVLRDEILTGVLQPGDRLIAPELAARFSVSQTPAREAIQALQAEGLVTISSYKNARVAYLNADECEEVYLMREALEKLAARLGAANTTDEQLDEMNSYLTEMAEAARSRDIDRFVRADREFHRVQFAAAGRPRLWERIIGLRLAGERYTRLSYQELPQEMDRSIPRHQALLDTLREHDPERAAEWISNTLGGVPLRMRQLLGEPTGRQSDTGERQ